MSTKHLSAASFCFMTVATLSAQTPAAALRNAGINGSDLENLIHQIEDNAIIALLIITVLTGLLFVLCACAGLNKKPKNPRISSPALLLVVAAGLSIFGNSCTAAQKAQAADIRAAQFAEGHYCVCHAPQQNNSYNSIGGMNNQYPYQNHSTSQAKAFCKYCGHRVYNGNR